MSFIQLLVTALILPTINSQTIIYKQGTCTVTSIKKTKCGFWGWGNYYVYTLTPTNCDPISSSSSQCTYDDSNGKTDCESWGDFAVNDKRSCWIKYIDDKCDLCDCTDCDDDKAGTCKFSDGCIDQIPTLTPTLQPSKYPTISPTFVPTPRPTPAPTDRPTNVPTKNPTKSLIDAPTVNINPISEESEYERSQESGGSIMLNHFDYVSCLGVTVPCQNAQISTTKSSECPLLSITEYELNNIELPISDKDYTIETLSLFKIKQSISAFWNNTHYWFQIHVVNQTYEIRYIAPYADQVINYFQNHFYINKIGQTSMLPLIEFVSAYNSNNPGKFVLYAGTFTTDENGKINYWSNDSPHFLPSVAYAAPVASALGIEDAIFVPWISDKYDQTIYYRQYKRYTGVYNAKQSINNLIGGMNEKVDTHNYGHKQRHNKHNFGNINENFIVLIGLLFGLLFCMIGMVVGITKINKQKHNIEENSRYD